MIYLIGSQALSVLGKNYRAPKDWDMMMTPEEFTQAQEIWSQYPDYTSKESSKFKGKYHVTFKVQDAIMGAMQKVDIEIDATDNCSRRFLTEQVPMEKFADRATDVFGVRAYVPALQTLWVFKRSHANYPIFVGKTLNDMMWLNKLVIGEQLEPTSRNFLTVDESMLLEFLRHEAKERNTKRDARISFNKPYKEFFTNTVERQYTHDDLHRATCYYSDPLYLGCLSDPESALIDMKKFNAMPFMDRLIMVQEEAIAIGLERFRSDDARRTYQSGLFKVVADLSKGRFQDFIIDHIHLLKTPLWDFQSKFNDAVLSNRILPTHNQNVA